MQSAFDILRQVTIVIYIYIKPKETVRDKEAEKGGKMGNQKQKWKAEEEEALLAGVAKHGPGKWKNILKDPEFAPFLTHRSNIDLKVPSSLLFYHSLYISWLPLLDILYIYIYIFGFYSFIMYVKTLETRKFSRIGISVVVIW